MSWKKGLISTGDNTAHKVLIEEIEAFVTKSLYAGTVTPGANTGDGLLVGQSATENSVAETITVTCTAGGSPATFSVTGSTTGVLPTATTDTTYSESVASFVVYEGSVDFIIGDSFSFPIASGTPRWSTNRLENTPGSDYEAMLQGVGYTGTDEIFVGLKSYDGNYGIKVQGSTTFTGGYSFEDQVGASISYVPMLETTLDYWLISTDQHIKGIIKSGAVYTGFYIGYLDSNATTSQWSYPLVSGGTANSEIRYTDPSNTTLSMFWLSSASAASNVAKIQIFDGTEWLPKSFYGLSMLVWPHNGGVIPSLFNEDGSVVKFPATPIMYSSNSNPPTASQGRVAGELEGVHHISSIGSTVTTESLLIDGNNSYIITQDTNRPSILAAFHLKED